MSRDGAMLRPAKSNSFSFAFRLADDLFIFSANGRVARLKVNSPVSTALYALSFRPSLEKAIMFGLAETALKKE